MGIFQYICTVILIHSEQMYKKHRKTAIAKTRYSFKKGYLQVPICEKEKVREELKNILGISRSNYFSTILNSGIVDISLPKYELINQAFARRNITDVWDITELPQPSQPERAR